MQPVTGGFTDDFFYTIHKVIIVRMGKVIIYMDYEKPEVFENRLVALAQQELLQVVL
jgi:hypothetical protein